MVERPIKKSERQQMAESNVTENAAEGQVETRSSPPPQRRNRDKEDRPDRGERSERPDRGSRNERSDRGERNDRGRGKGKGRGERSDAEKKPVNLALMRGPRPVKPQAPAEEPPVEEPLAEAVETEETTGTETPSEADSTDAVTAEAPSES